MSYRWLAINDWVVNRINESRKCYCRRKVVKSLDSRHFSQMKAEIFLSVLTSCVMTHPELFSQLYDIRPGIYCRNSRNSELCWIFLANIAYRYKRQFNFNPDLFVDRSLSRDNFKFNLDNLPTDEQGPLVKWILDYFNPGQSLLDEEEQLPHMGPWFRFNFKLPAAMFTM